MHSKFVRFLIWSYTLFIRIVQRVNSDQDEGNKCCLNRSYSTTEHTYTAHTAYNATVTNTSSILPSWIAWHSYLRRQRSVNSTHCNVYQSSSNTNERSKVSSVLSIFSHSQYSNHNTNACSKRLAGTF